MSPSAKPAPAKKARSKARPVPSGARRVRGWIFRPRVLLCVASVVAAVLFGPRIFERLPNLQERDEYQTRLRDVVVTSPNAWVPAHLTEEILQEAGLPESLSILHPELCRDLALAWQQNAWIRSVNRCWISNKPAIHLEVEYRLPVAFIESNAGLYPVDEDGVLLPPSDFAMSDIDRLPHVRNISSLPRGPAGTRWGDERVRQAASIAAVLMPDQNLETYWKKFGLQAILAPTSEEETAFELETTGGSRLVWGRAPGEDSLEPTVAQKLARMQDYLNRFGTFDAADGRYRIDIRQFDAITLEPLEGRRLR